MPMQPLKVGTVKQMLSSRDNLALWEQDDARMLAKPLPPEPPQGTIQWRDWDAQRQIRAAAEERQRLREEGGVDASLPQGPEA